MAMTDIRGEGKFSEGDSVEKLMVKDDFDVSSDLKSHKIFE